MKQKRVEQLLAINFPDKRPFSTLQAIDVIRTYDELSKTDLSDSAIYKHMKNLLLEGKIAIAFRTDRISNEPSTTFYYITDKCNRKELAAENNENGVYLQDIFLNLGKGKKLKQGELT